MIVGALLDAGADFAQLQNHLARLGLDEFTVTGESVRRAGIGGTKFHVLIHNPGSADHGHPHGHSHDHSHEHDHDHPHEHGQEHGHSHEEHDHAAPSRHRGLAEILRLIDSAALPVRAAERARRIFQRLGEAEAHVHRVPLEDVHFHEVGAVDSIVDIVGACVALELLGVDRVICSPIPAGSGTFRCAHGELPAPAPATAALLSGGAVLADKPLRGEVTTPTGAAILTTLAESYGPLPAMAVSAVGYGAGTRDAADRPNLLRVYLGQPTADGDSDHVVELSANIDDVSGEVLGHAMGRLMELGALDAWATPIYMKKNRPATQISALCLPADVDAVQAVLFAETTTFGVRRMSLARTKLERTFQAVETAYGPIRVKVGRRGGRVLSAAPEFADCQAAARSHHVTVKEVMEATLTAWRTGNETGSGE